MALKFISFAELPLTGGVSGVGGEVARKGPTHEGLPAPIAQKNRSPQDLISDVHGGNEKIGGVTESQYPCGFQALDPVNPILPTSSDGVVCRVSNEAGRPENPGPEIDSWAALDAKYWCGARTAMNTGDIDAVPVLQPVELRSQPPKKLPPGPMDWREPAAAYHAHHFDCPACIAAGRGPQYGLRCGPGLLLWDSYAEQQVTSLECTYPITLPKQGMP
jgi:hypothetical protein